VKKLAQVCANPSKDNPIPVKKAVQVIEYYRVNVTVVDTLCREPEKTVSAKATVRGCRQRFKPNITRASGRKEDPGKDAGSDKMSHPQPKGETEKVCHRVR